MPQSHLTHGLRAQHGHTARSPSQNPTRTNTQHHCPTRPWPAAQNPSRPQHSPDQSPATESATGTWKPDKGRHAPGPPHRTQADPTAPTRVQARARDPGGAPIYRTRRPTSPGRPDRAQQPGTRLSQKTAQQPPPLPEPKQYQHGPDQSRDPGRGTAPTA